MKPNLQEISFSVDKLSGLTDAEITKSRFEHGANVLKAKTKRNIFQKVLHVLAEPMFLLLFGAASIYFLVGEVTDGVIMLCCVLFVSGIEFFKNKKLTRRLKRLIPYLLLISV